MFETRSTAVGYDGFHALGSSLVFSLLPALRFGHLKAFGPVDNRALLPDDNNPVTHFFSRSLVHLLLGSLSAEERDAHHSGLLHVNNGENPWALLLDWYDPRGVFPTRDC